MAERKKKIDDALLVLTKTLYFVQNERVAAQVRILHLAKKKKKCELTNQILERELAFETWLNMELKTRIQKHPAYSWFSQVKGVGDLNIGKLIGYIDIEKATTISKLWRYAGFGLNSDGKAEFRKKGEKLHYNKTLKSMCWRLAKSLIRAKGPYYKYYREKKKKIQERLTRQGFEIIPSKELPTEKGKHIEKDGFFGLGHVDMMAQRKMVKLFLSHLWLKWRTALDLPVSLPYAHGILGHEQYEDPDNFIS